MRSTLAKIVCLTSVQLLLLTPASLTCAQSTRPGVGAIPFNGGTTFRVWAPNASHVSVKGSFSGWGTVDLQNESNGHWSTDVAGAVHGQEYKFVITHSGFSFDKMDARSRRVSNSAGNSIIYDHGLYDWQGDNFSTPWHNDLVMYQLHPGAFKAQPNGWTPGTFWDAVTKIEHLQNLGINVVQLMPACEFAGDHSWGYNPGVQYAVESAYGGPDALKDFVRECHKRGIGVFVDLVHNHYGPSDNTLWQYDGWNQWGLGGIYFYQDDRRFTDWGETRPDYGRSEVQNFIRDQVRMWLDDYHIDGFRWDSINSMRNTNQGSNPQGEWLVWDINRMIHDDYPGVISIAEDNSSGLGFDSEWDAADVSEFEARIRWVLTQPGDASRDMGLVAGEINDGSNHGRVIYTESHDTVAEENGKVRLPAAIDPGNPESIWARKRTLLGAALTMTSVGIPMMHQGQELLENWGFKAQNALRWERADSQKGIVDAYTDLIHLRRNFYGDSQGLKGTGCNVFHVDHVNKVVAFHRWDFGGVGDDVVVVMNFAATTWENNSYSINFPYGGDWYVLYNSDDQKYGSDFGNIGGSDINASGNPAGASVNMGMYATIVYGRSRHDPPVPSEATFSPPAPTGCEDVTITYEANDGPLSGASTIFVHLGRNDWQETESPDQAMSWDGIRWTYVYSSPLDTEEINFSFTDGAGAWDNNSFKNWSAPMSDCIDTTPSDVTVVPEFPSGCEPVTISYIPNAGPLEGATNVYIHLGLNSWSLLIEPGPLMSAISNQWEYTFTPPEGISELNFVFHNGDPSPGSRIWDNNSGSDWEVAYPACYRDPVTIAINDPLNGINTTNEFIDLAGTSSATNGQAFVFVHDSLGSIGTTGAASDWSKLQVPLELGENVLMVAVPKSMNAASIVDQAQDLVYQGGAWSTGQNGGGGMGGWILKRSANAGHFVADALSISNLDVDAKAWGLWAVGADTFSSAYRSFESVLSVGATVCLDFENNFIETGGSAGFNLQNQNGDKLFEFYFQGGDSTYSLRDDSGVSPTSVGWTDSGLSVKCTLLSPKNYQVVIGSYTNTGSLIAVPDNQIVALEAWNYQAGGGEDHNLYVNNISITNDAWEAFDSVQIVRTAGVVDSDGDGMMDTWEQAIVDANPGDSIVSINDVLPGDNYDLDSMINYDEFIAGTDPLNPQSYFSVNDILPAGTDLMLRFDTVRDRTYSVWYSDTSDMTNWQNATVTQDIWGDDSVKEWMDLIQGGPDVRRYKVEVAYPQAP